MSSVPLGCACGAAITTDHIVHTLPSLPQRAVNLAVDSVTHLANGSKQVPDEVRAWRLSQCESCVEYFDAKLKTCAHPRCGCGMRQQRGIIDALSWASKRCPIGRWDNPTATGEASAETEAAEPGIAESAAPDSAP